LINYKTSVQEVLGLQAHIMKNETPVVPQLPNSPDLSPADFPVPETGN
jgi:hypothetical protein